MLQRFEKRLEGLVEGAFAKVFKGVVHPVEILNAMQREAEAHKAILAGGRTLVPNRYVIDLSPYDHSRLAPYAAALAQELAQSQAEFIGEQAWTVYGDVIVEIERGEGLDTGMFRVTAEVYTGGDVAPAPRPATTPAAGYPPYDQQRPATRAQPGRAARPATSRLVSGDGRTYPLTIGLHRDRPGDQANLRLPDVGHLPPARPAGLRRRPGRADRPRLDQRHHGQRPAGLRGGAEPGRHDPDRHDHTDVPRGRLATLPEIRPHRRPVRLPRAAVDLRVHGRRSDPAGPVRRAPGHRLVATPRGVGVAPGPGRPAKVKRGRAAHQLVVTAGQLAGTRITLGEAQITIGRAEDSTLVITDDYASARHARLVPRDGQWFVEDLGSTNGTYLDRAKVTGTTPVPLGVPIRIGRTSLELRP